MRKILVVSAVAASGALCLGAAAAASAATLDQQQLVGNMDTYIDSGQSLAQTFTAGIDGDLDRVDLLLRVVNTPTLPLTVEIRDGTADTPGGAVLASQSVAPSGITASFALVSITFPVPAPVAAGTQYAIVTYSATAPPTHYSWARSPSDVYAGGRGLYVSASPPPGIWVDDGGSDHVFQTYVAPPPTPSTPATSPAPTTTGLQAAALARCKQRAQKHAWPKKRLRKCKKNARLLPV